MGPWNQNAYILKQTEYGVVLSQIILRKDYVRLLISEIALLRPFVPFPLISKYRSYIILVTIVDCAGLLIGSNEN